MLDGMPYLMPVYIMVNVVLAIWGIYILYLITKALRIYIAEKSHKNHKY